MVISPLSSFWNEMEMHVPPALNLGMAYGLDHGQWNVTGKRVCQFWAEALRSTV